MEPVVGIVQFYVAKPVAAAADVDHLSARLAARGAEHTRFERSTFRAQGRLRVTCKVTIALAMLEEIRAARDSATTFALRDACDAAAREVEQAIASVHTGALQPKPPGQSDAELGLLGS